MRSLEIIVSLSLAFGVSALAAPVSPRSMNTAGPAHDQKGSIDCETETGVPRMLDVATPRQDESDPARSGDNADTTSSSGPPSLDVSDLSATSTSSMSQAVDSAQFASINSGDLAQDGVVSTDTFSGNPALPPANAVTPNLVQVDAAIPLNSFSNVVQGAVQGSSLNSIGSILSGNPALPPANAVTPNLVQVDAAIPLNSFSNVVQGAVQGSRLNSIGSILSGNPALPPANAVTPNLVQVDAAIPLNSFSNVVQGAVQGSRLNSIGSILSGNPALPPANADTPNLVQVDTAIPLDSFSNVVQSAVQGSRLNSIGSILSGNPALPPANVVTPNFIQVDTAIPLNSFSNVVQSAVQGSSLNSIGSILSGNPALPPANAVTPNLVQVDTAIPLNSFSNVVQSAVQGSSLNSIGSIPIFSGNPAANAVNVSPNVPDPIGSLQADSNLDAVVNSFSSGNLASNVVIGSIPFNIPDTSLITPSLSLISNDVEASDQIVTDPDSATDRDGNCGCKSAHI